MNKQAFDSGFLERWHELQKEAGVYDDYIKPGMESLGRMTPELMSKLKGFGQQAWQGAKGLGQQAAGLGGQGLKYMDDKYMDFMKNQLVGGASGHKH